MFKKILMEHSHFFSLKTMFIAICLLVCNGSLSSQTLDLGALGDYNLDDMTIVVDREVSAMQDCAATFKGYQKDKSILYIADLQCYENKGYKTMYIKTNNGHISDLLTRSAFWDEGQPTYEEVRCNYWWNVLEITSGKIENVHAKLAEADKENSRCGMSTPECKEELNSLKIEAQTMIGRLHNSELSLGQELRADEKIWSKCNLYYCNVNQSGQLAIYKKDGHLEWSTKSSAQNSGEDVYLELHEDGNICIYDQEDVATWCSNTAGLGGVTLQLGYWGMLKLLDKENNEVWRYK